MSVVKCAVLMPRKPLSCWRAIVIAAPPIKPTIAACDRKSIKNPNLNAKIKIKKQCNHKIVIMYIKQTIVAAGSSCTRHKLQRI